ncbi:MAG: hypothetical protein P9F19_04530 [Candidatus Contendobacter sp.]|nr:hypothetical protein [Candidatus Contendobacter sp.]MDG4556645.1 hypothetical protein [Candidatus Contendobacter sp.]
MKAQELIRRRTAVAETAFADIVVWQAPQLVSGRRHLFKYRLAFLVDGDGGFFRRHFEVNA